MNKNKGTVKLAESSLPYVICQESEGGAGLNIMTKEGAASWRCAGITGLPRS